MAIIKLGIGPAGYDTTIEVDGHSMTNAARALTLYSAVNDISTLTLDLIVFEEATVSGEATVVVPPWTRDALIALGWTPPTDQAEG